MTWGPMLVKILLCFLMVFVDMQGSKGCLENERLGLLKIKDSFVDPDIDYEPVLDQVLPSWGDGNCCWWERVNCNETTGRVTHLFLDSVRPPGWIKKTVTLNFSLLPFEQLMYLDLSDNSLSGSVEIKGLCGLKNLQELDISQNDIVSLPDCMGNLTSLRVLDLSSTSMTGNVPSFITSLKSLEYISLFDTKINGFFSFSLLANHSKLVVFRLSTNSDKLHVETESPPWLPMFHLNVLQLANCNLNAKQNSTIPRFLLHQHELRLLDLSHNKLKGDFPTWILNSNSKLETLRLKDNSFTGTLQLPTSIHGLLNLEISSNKFGGQLPKDIGKIFPNLSFVNLARNLFEGGLSSMVEMQRVQRLDLSNNKFSGELARQLFSNWTSLELLNISHNNFSGQVFPKFANSAGLKFLLLNNNHFFGEIADRFLNKSYLQVMDISYNMVSGRIPRWIANFTSLELLSMSNNLLEAEIPKEICSLQSLNFIDLSKNSLSGTLHDCLYKLNFLSFLHLQKNALTGSIPNVISDSLHSLDLRDNRIYGEVQLELLRATSFLRVFLLGGNQLNGSIPDELCQLTHLQILDLSRNKFTGTIPSCFAITFSFTDENSCYIYDYVSRSCITDTLFIWPIFENDIPSYNSTLVLNYHSLDDNYVINESLPAEFRTKHNIYSYMGNILLLMSGLDLSSNELNGSIPPEIGHIGNIDALNLSHNRLSGTIPQSFSNLEKVESLDLSYNNFSGPIPSNLTEMHFLEIFNVSYNNLSGPTPTTGQFANFGEDNYKGNPGLFGFLNGSSYRTLSPPPPPSENTSNERGENHTAIELVSFYWGFVSSYVTVILGLAIILWFSPRWCRVWFQFVDLCIYYCFPCFFRDGIR